MGKAGELDDRWPEPCKWNRREESPDTTSRVRVGQSKDWPLHKRRLGNAPGNARGCDCASKRVTESATENQTASGAYPGDRPEENLRNVFEWCATKVRVKRWGKSPPLRQ